MALGTALAVGLGDAVAQEIGHLSEDAVNKLAEGLQGRAAKALKNLAGLPSGRVVAPQSLARDYLATTKRESSRAKRRLENRLVDAINDDTDDDTKPLELMDVDQDDYITGKVGKAEIQEGGERIHLGGVKYMGDGVMMVPLLKSVWFYSTSSTHASQEITVELSTGTTARTVTDNNTLAGIYTSSLSGTLENDFNKEIVVNRIVPFNYIFWRHAQTGDRYRIKYDYIAISVPEFWDNVTTQYNVDINKVFTLGGLIKLQPLLSWVAPGETKGGGGGAP